MGEGSSQEASGRASALLWSLLSHVGESGALGEALMGLLGQMPAVWQAAVEVARGLEDDVGARALADEHLEPLLESAFERVDALVESLWEQDDALWELAGRLGAVVDRVTSDERLAQAAVALGQRALDASDRALEAMAVAALSQQRDERAEQTLGAVEVILGRVVARLVERAFEERARR